MNQADQVFTKLQELAATKPTATVQAAEKQQIYQQGVAAALARFQTLLTPINSISAAMRARAVQLNEAADLMDALAGEKPAENP